MSGADQLLPLVGDVEQTRSDRIRALATRLWRRVAYPRISVFASAMIVLVGCLLAGRLLLGVPATVSVLIAGGTLAGGIVTLSSDRPPLQLLGGLMLYPAGGIAVAALDLPLQLLSTSPIGAMATFIVITALGVAGTSITLAASRRPAAAMLDQANSRGLRSVLGGGLAILVTTVPGIAFATGATAAAGGLLGDVARELLGTTTGFAALVFPLLMTVALLSLSRAVGSVPVDVLVPAASRWRVQWTQTRLHRGFTIGSRLSLLLLLVLPVVAFLGGSLRIEGLRGVLSGGSLLVVRVVATSVAIRVLLLVSIAAAWLTICGVLVLRWIHGMPIEALARRLAAFIGGFIGAVLGAGGLVAIGLAGAVHDAVGDVFGPVAAIVFDGMGAYGLGVVLLVLVGFVAVLLSDTVRLVAIYGLSTAVATPGLGATALVVLSLITVLTGNALYGFVVMALAMVAWDTGEYGDGLQRELSPDAATTRAELLHVAWSLVVGGVVVAVAYGLGTILTVARTAPAPGFVALVLAVVAALVLINSL